MCKAELNIKPSGIELEVYTGPGLVLQLSLTRPRSKTGSGGTDDVLVWARFKWQQTNTYKVFQAFSGNYLQQKKINRTCAHLMLATQLGSGNKSQRFEFFWDFHSCLLPQMVQNKTLQTWYPMSLYRSSNTNIPKDVLRVSLNNSIKDYQYLYIIQ